MIFEEANKLLTEVETDYITEQLKDGTRLEQMDALVEYFYKKVSNES